MAGNEATYQPRSTILLGISTAMAAFSIYAGFRTRGLTTRFRETFDALGADLPPVTKFVLGAPNLWWVIATPATLAFLWIALKPRVTASEGRRMKAAVIAVILFGAAVYGFVAFALYKPMFELGSAV